MYVFKNMYAMSTGLIFATNSASVSMVQDITPDNCQFLSECLDRRSYATSGYDIIMASVDGTSRGEWSGGRDKPCHLTTSNSIAFGGGCT